MNIHIVPVNDKIEHDLDEDCICCPTPEFYEGATVWIHAAADGREGLEDFFGELAEEMNFGGWEIWCDEYTGV
jgi:hypothetical protein